MNPHFVILLLKRLWSLIQGMHTDLHLTFYQFFFAMELLKHNGTTVSISNQRKLHIYNIVEIGICFDAHSFYVVFFCKVVLSSIYSVYISREF